jgi:phosphatidylglycerophosphatase C
MGMTLDDWTKSSEKLKSSKASPSRTSESEVILEMAVQDDKGIQDFELESLLMGGGHSQKVKAPLIRSDYSSKDCVNLSSSTAVLRIVAAFDFDGTITTRDSLVPFLFFLKGTWKALWLFISLLSSLALFSLKIISRQTAKEKILTRFLAGMPIDVLRQKGAEYAAGSLKSLVRPEALERILWHQSQGHRCVIVSASIDLYLPIWAKEQGFDHVISSQLEITSDGRVTGILHGQNCWGEEKVHRLRAWLGDEKTVYLYAYGDSRGDQELLAIADSPHWRSMGDER